MNGKRAKALRKASEWMTATRTGKNQPLTPRQRYRALKKVFARHAVNGRLGV